MRDDDIIECRVSICRCFFRVVLSCIVAYLHTQSENLPLRKKACYLKLVCSIEVLQGLLHSHLHRFLALTDPISWIIVFLVWLILYRGVSVDSASEKLVTYRPIWVSDLFHKIILFLENVVTDTFQVCPLHIGVEILR